MERVFVRFVEKLLRQMKTCSKIEGQPLERFYESVCRDNILKLANGVVSDANRALDTEYRLLPSNWRNTI